MTNTAFTDWQKLTNSRKNAAITPDFGKNRFGRVLAGFWQSTKHPWQGFGRPFSGHVFSKNEATL